MNFTNIFTAVVEYFYEKKTCIPCTTTPQHRFNVATSFSEMSMCQETKVLILRYVYIYKLCNVVSITFVLLGSTFCLAIFSIRIGVACVQM